MAEPEPPAVRVQRRGDPEAETGEALEPGAFALLAMLDPDLGDHDSGEAERRAALARWITDARNPNAPALAKATGLRLEAGPPVDHGGLMVRLYQTAITSPQ